MKKRYTPLYTLKLVRERGIMYDSTPIIAPERASKIGAQLIGNKDREHVAVLCLDTKNRLIACQIVSIGSLNTSIIHPREVFKIALLTNSNAIIMLHNHPTGDATPSKDDIVISKKIKSAGEILGIQLLDHIILGEGSFYSLQENDYI